jgi:hypothetical protein
MDIKLGTDGDLDITNNQLTLVEGQEYIAQSWRIRLLTIHGEWFLDQRIGIPYFEYILVKNPNESLVRSLFRQATYSVSGIKEILGIEYDLDNASRALSLGITGRFEDLTTFKFSFSEMILSVGRLPT